VTATDDTARRYRQAVVASPIGPLTLVESGGALAGLYMDEHKHLPPAGRLAEPAPPGAEPPPGVLADTAQQLAEYFAGERTEFDLPLALEGSAWQLRVWAGLQGIGYGETISYGELARRIGAQPAASRAVGLANGRNPVSIIVPCHRVIGADGNMTGYGGGLPRKRFLLMHEQRVSGQTLA
jgi:methylated-DNA-[protein]-cysteine S-methyltransferase